MKRFGSVSNPLVCKRIDIPPPKEVCTEPIPCKECSLLVDRLNELSILLHRSENEKKEIHSALTEEIDKQFQINQGLINVIEGMKEQTNKKQELEKEIEEKEKKVERLEKETVEKERKDKLIPRVARLQKKVGF